MPNYSYSGNEYTEKYNYVDETDADDINNLQDEVEIVEGVLTGGTEGQVLTADATGKAGWEDASGGGLNYKVYSALITQNDTDDPTAIVLENTLGTITWRRDYPGYFVAVSDELFTENKTAYFGAPSQVYGGPTYCVISIERNSSSEVVLQVYNVNTDTDQDNALSGYSLEIRVYD